MVYLIGEEYQRNYVARKTSLAFIFCFVIYAIAIVLPFFLAFSTDNFWIKASTAYEQPTVNYRNEYLLYAYSDNNVYIGTSIKDVAEIVENPLPNVIMKSLAIDGNNDNLIDSFKQTISFAASETIKSVKLVLFFDYGLRGSVKAQMVGLVSIDVSSPTGISKAFVQGEIQLKQRSAILSG
eukprot:TRINITY_DN4106_c0_g2_i2.p1 TRINITY_DN4106_c0_g2~~TRINITY_DN4106_c0_g2_i2.p1  ORF type:complete len:181 (+),score=30.30 TRINITY_DN4106_c0_g2_i2:156-698(+)